MSEGSGVDFTAFYQKHGMQWGAGDMFVVGPYRPLERFAELITVLAVGQNQDGALAVRNIILVHPPGTDNEADFEEALREEIRGTFVRWRGTALDESEERALAKRLQVTATRDMQASSVLSVIEAAPACTAIIVTQGALYRTPDADGLAPIAAESAVAMPEDFWVPHFNALCQRAIGAAGQSETYVALDAGEEWPARESHRKLLLSIDSCGVISGEVKDSPDAVLATRIDDWNAKIAAGKVGAVLSEIDALPSTLDRSKPLLRLQALEKVGYYPMVLDELRNRPELTEGLPPTIALQVASIAFASGAPDIARTLLSNTRLEGLPPERLESALLLAERTRVDDVLARCKILLTAMYPPSLALREVRINELFAKRQYSDLAHLLAESTSDGERTAAEMYGIVAEALQGETTDYAAILQAIESRVPSQKDLTKRVLGREALLNGQPAQALETILPDSENAEIEEATASSILAALERVVLTRDDKGRIGVDPDTASIAISHVLRYVAHHPADGSMRIRLVDVMSAQSMGGLGLAVLATLVLRFAREPSIPRPAPKLGNRSATSSPEDVLAFMRVALPWLSDNGPIYLGRTTLPESLLTGPPDGLIEGAKLLLAHYDPVVSATDAETFGMLIAAAISIVPHGTDKNADLTIIRIAAVRFALASHFQKARDYAEHALQLAGADPCRVRLAWLCFSDVYQRTGEIIQGFVAIACGLSADRLATSEQVWYESVLLFRITRDLRMIPFAISFLEAGRAALQNLGVLDKYEQRIETLILQARFLENGAGGQAAVEDLFAPIVANAQAVLERHDEPEPVAALLSEAIRQSTIQGGTVPSEARDVLKQLVERCSQSQSAIIAAIGAESPSADQVLTVARQIEAAMQADDTAYDVRSLVILAERLLASAEASGDPWTAVFAIELMADHAISLPTSANGPAWQSPHQIRQPGELAAELSDSTGLPLVMIGMDSRGLLLRTTAADGTLHTPVCETSETFSENRLDNWSQEFPFRYGIDMQAMNLFYTSTEGIGVSELLERAVLVMSAELQPYPANLLRLGNELAGFSRRLAVVPSLAWLESARTAQPSANTRHVAWIPTTGPTEGSATLTTVADRIRDPLAKYGVALDEGAIIPADLRGAELAIVTAHGGLIPEGRFFQVVQDDANLKASSAELADALSGVGVVILFVCSGGRMDKHPMANTTLGLVRQLLSNGCTSVVASPWPLDSRVPSYWIPIFLELWHSGSSVIDAVFDANANVRGKFSGEPRDCLAMHLYGDPLRRKIP
ncbi:MAG: hypothetical protein CMK02_07090 [Polycyclovorans sp.]|nr:hypothetical protein [Polycyclovorans sp.]